MNPFQNSYHSRLREWKNLRILLSNGGVEPLIEVDRWWQQAPLVNHYLHPLDPASWPDPWTLLSDNIYCQLTRAIGICYTLLMADIDAVELVQATNPVGEEHNLVLVDGAKYILNYYPGCVLSTHLNGFTVKRTLSIDTLAAKIK